MIFFSVISLITSKRVGVSKEVFVVNKKSFNASLTEWYDLCVRSSFLASLKQATHIKRYSRFWSSSSVIFNFLQRCCITSSIVTLSPMFQKKRLVPMNKIHNDSYNIFIHFSLRFYENFINLKFIRLNFDFHSELVHFFMYFMYFL